MQGLKHESLSHESKLEGSNSILDIVVEKDRFASRLKKDALFILVLLLGGLVPIINLF